jgi:hypothetical protein
LSRKIFGLDNPHFFKYTGGVGREPLIFLNPPKQKVTALPTPPVYRVRQAKARKKKKER